MPSYYSAYQNGQRLRMDITWSQSIEGNYSSVTIATYQEVASGFVADSSWRIGFRVDGNNWFDWTAYRSISSTQQTASKTATVTHNADGTRTINAYAWSIAQSTGYFDQGVSSGNLALPTIPRATTPTWSGNFVAGEEKTINLPRASSAFTHDVSYTFATESGTIGTGAGTSVDWTPPLSLLNAMTTTPSAAGTLTVVTKNGATTIGTRSVPFTLEAGPDIVPVVSDITWEETNATVAANIGAFVQSVSRPRGVVSATGVYGSTITSRSVTVDGTTYPNNTAFNVPNSGTLTASGSAIDSRGRQGTLGKNFAVLAYTPPRADGYDVFRSDASFTPVAQGEYLSVNLAAFVSPLTVASVEKNAITVTIATKPTNAPGEFTQRNSFGANMPDGLGFVGFVLVGGGEIYLQTTSYDVRVQVSDETGSISTYIITVPVAQVTLDLVGNSVGIGKLWEEGTLDVGGDTFIRGQLNVEDNTEIAGTLRAFNQSNDLVYIAPATQTQVNDGTDEEHYVTPDTMYPALEIWGDKNIGVGPVIPDSVILGGGTATVNSKGVIQLSGVNSSIRLDGVFDIAQPSTYELFLSGSFLGSSAFSTRLQSDGTDLTAYDNIGIETRLSYGPARYEALTTSGFGHWFPTTVAGANFGGRMTLSFYSNYTTYMMSSNMICQSTGGGTRRQWVESAWGNARTGIRFIMSATANFVGVLRIVRVA